MKVDGQNTKVGSLYMFHHNRGFFRSFCRALFAKSPKTETETPEDHQGLAGKSAEY